MKEIGEIFKIHRYSMINRTVARMEVRIVSGEALREKTEHLVAVVQMSQEQT
jgi:hypothetical protein